MKYIEFWATLFVILVVWLLASCTDSATGPPPDVGHTVERIQAKLNDVERDIRIARREGVMLEVIMFTFGDSLPVFVVREAR